MTKKMDNKEVLKWATVEELDKQLANIRLQEEISNEELGGLLAERTYVDDKIRALAKIIPTLNTVKQEAESLVFTIKNLSQTTDKISCEIKTVDLARTRIEDCQERISALIDINLYTQGVQKSIEDEDYETGASLVHKFLSTDQNLLTKKCGQALLDAASLLRAIVKHRFDQATKNGDLCSINRFFKIFPLLGLHKEGITDFCNYLGEKLKGEAHHNLSAALNTPKGDERYPVVYADTLTLFFEGLMRIIDLHQPLIKTYYGPGWLLPAVTILHRACGNQYHKVIMNFNKNRKLSTTISLIAELRNSDSWRNLERIGTKDLEILIGELTVMLSRVDLYIKYIKRKVTNDFEGGISDEFKDLEAIINNSLINKSRRELLEKYLRLEQYYMEESIRKAVNMETLDTKTSSFVDDTFFIIRKCIRRAISTGSLDGCCTVIKMGCDALESDYSTHLKQEYLSGYLDFAQDNKKPGDKFLVALNNADFTCEYVDALYNTTLQDIEWAMPTLNHNEEGKLRCCLSDLSSVKDHFQQVSNYGMQRLQCLVLKPKLNSWVDAFLTTNHQITQDELFAYEAGVSFVQTLIINLDSLLTSFKDALTSTNYDTLVGLITADVTARLETVIFKSTFNQLGGLILDKEIRILAGYLTTSTSWSVRDKFARLTEIASILNLEKVSEIVDYWGNHEGALRRHLTPMELRTVLRLRIDFETEDIDRLKL